VRVYGFAYYKRKRENTRRRGVTDQRIEMFRERKGNPGGNPVKTSRIGEIWEINTEKNNEWMLGEQRRELRGGNSNVRETKGRRGPFVYYPN